MEDPDLEWKIQEYSSSEGSSKVSWILNKGLRLGKKVVITGIVISFAPLVLPPLLVFSAFGLAFSVPFGFFLASYACTEKLMSKLLSRPTPPIMWEYGTDEEEDMGFGGGIDMEEEEEEQMEEQEPAKYVGEIVEKEGYEKDDEDLMEKKEQPLTESDMAIEGMGEKAGMEESRGEQPVEEMGGVVVVVEGNGSNVEVKEPNGLTSGVEESGGVEKVIDIEEEEILTRETRGLKERIRDDGNVVNEQRAKKMRGPADKRDEKCVRNVEERIEEDTADTLPREVKPLGDKSEMIHVGSIIREEHKPVVDKKAMLQAGRTDDNIAREKENVIRSTADAREIADESGFNSFDDKNAAGGQYSVHETPEENKHSSRNIGEGGADFVEHPVSAGVPKSRHAVIFSEKDITLSSDKNVEEEGNYGGGLDLEEEVLTKDTKDGIEIRIELVEKRNEELEEVNLLPRINHGRDGVNKDEKKPIKFEKGRGYEEDFGDNPPKEEEHPLVETGVIIEGMREEENANNIKEKEIIMEDSRDWQPVEEGVGIVFVIGEHEKNASNVEGVEEPFGVTNGVEEKGGDERVVDIKEEGKPAREIRVVIEESRDEGNVDNTMEDDDEQHLKEICGVAEKGYEGNVRNVKEMEKPSEDKYVDYDVKLEKLVGETKATLKESRDEIVPKENEKMCGSSYEDNVDTVSKEMKPIKEMGGILEGSRDKMNDNNSLEAEELMGDINGMINVGIMIEEEQKSMVDKKDGVLGGIAENYVAHEDRQLDREKGNAIFLNEDARETADESGFALFDEENASALQYCNEVHENPEGEVIETEAIDYYPPFSDMLDHKVEIDLAHGSVQNEQSSNNIDDSSSDFVGLPVSANLPESKHAQIASEKEITMPSNKALYGEEKIWEQIDALQTIVGYKAASRTTCIEEIKALYIFTGVEPPVTFKEPSDLVEVNKKLRFLMSIVGVK